MTAQREEDPDYCPVTCGCGGKFVDCWSCGGEGGHDGYEEDPLWYDEGDIIACDICGARGGFYVCLAAGQKETA